MTLFQPLLIVLIGVTLFLFGLIQSVSSVPDPLIWQSAFAVMPSFVAILYFVLATLIVLAGFTLAVRGVMTLRKRMRVIRRIDWSHFEEDRRRRHDHEDGGMYPTY